VRDAHVVHAHVLAGLGLIAVADGDVLDQKLGGRRTLDGADVGLVHESSSGRWRLPCNHMLLAR
jgi:hypothetical protein